MIFSHRYLKKVWNIRYRKSGRRPFPDRITYRKLENTQKAESFLLANQAISDGNFAKLANLELKR
jgi:hypothetical protein